MVHECCAGGFAHGWNINERDAGPAFWWGLVLWCAVGFSGLRSCFFPVPGSCDRLVVVMGVGVVVWELHSGREHLIFVCAKHLSCFVFLVACTCGCKC